METNKGFTKINNDILNWEWYTQTNIKVLYFHLLLRANFEAKSWRGIIIERGQTVTSPESLAIETGLTVSKVRTALDKLIQTNYIKKEATNKYTVLSLLNYDVHTYSGVTTDKQISKQPDKQIATTKETKDLKIINTKDRDSVNKNSLSNFLEFNSNKEYLELVSRYKNKIPEFDICLKKFYDNREQKNISIVRLESWLMNWIKNNIKNKPVEDYKGLPCSKPLDKVSGF